MGGKSRSSNSSSQVANDNRVINQNDRRVFNTVDDRDDNRRFADNRRDNSRVTITDDRDDNRHFADNRSDSSRRTTNSNNRTSVRNTNNSRRTNNSNNRIIDDRDDNRRFTDARQNNSRTSVVTRVTDDRDDNRRFADNRSDNRVNNSQDHSNSVKKATDSIIAQGGSTITITDTDNEVVTEALKFVENTTDDLFDRFGNLVTSQQEQQQAFINAAVTNTAGGNAEGTRKIAYAALFAGVSLVAIQALKG